MTGIAAVGVHAEFCRQPLHPGPCAGWKAAKAAGRDHNITHHDLVPEQTRRRRDKQPHLPKGNNPDRGVMYARDRQARIDHARARADTLAEIEERVIINQARPETAVRVFDQHTRLRGVQDDPDIRKVGAALATGDPATLDKTLAGVAKKLGLERIGGPRGSSFQLVRFNRGEQRSLNNDTRPGQPVVLVRPGYAKVVDGDRLVLVKAVVENAAPDEIADAGHQLASAGHGALSDADRIKFNKLHPRAADGKFGHGAAGAVLSGLEALQSVPARLTPGKDAHHGKYEGESLQGPPGMGKVRALSQYEGTDYHNVNEFLRGNYRGQPGPGKLPPDDSDEYSAHKLLTRANNPGDLSTVDTVAEIDKTMQASRLTHDVVVERTVKLGEQVFGRDVWYGDVIDWNSADFDEQDRQVEVWRSGVRPDLTGLRFQDHAYSSTTVDPEITKAYADRFVRVTEGSLSGEPIVMRITVPAGTGAVALSPMEKGSEAEVLLERGLTFEVVQDHGVDDSGVRRLDVRVVPDGQ